MASRQKGKENATTYTKDNPDHPEYSPFSTAGILCRINFKYCSHQTLGICDINCFMANLVNLLGLSI